MSEPMNIWWVVYNPHTGDVLYTGYDHDAAKEALGNVTLQRLGYICEPQSPQVTAKLLALALVAEMRPLVKDMLDEFNKVYTPDKPKPPGGVIGEPPTIPKTPAPAKRTRKVAK